MTDHPCPFTLGQLLALPALVKVAGHERLAALLLEHSREHDTEATTTTKEQP